MKKQFQCEVGLSDHTMGLGTSVAAISNGASVIEKHFTLSRSDGGVDSTFSMEPEEMKQLVREAKRAWMSLGEVSFGANEEDEKSLHFRQSIYTSNDIGKGEILNDENLRIIRPGFGLPPKEFNNILGRKSNRFLKKGTALSWEFIEK